MSLLGYDVVTGIVPFPDVQIIYLDRQWDNYDFPEHIENKFPSADHYVMTQCFAVLEDLDPAILEQAVQAMFVYHDGLRTRFAKENDRWIQRIAPPADEAAFVWQDLSSLSGEQRSETLKALLLREARSLSLSRGPTMKCVYLKLGGEEHGLLFLILSHVIADGVSFQILGSDLHMAIEQLTRGQAIQLPSKGTSIKAWGERMQAMLSSQEWLEECERLTAYKRAWPPASLQTLPIDYPEEKIDEKPSEEYRVALEAQETLKLVRQAGKIWGVRLLDLLQVALVKTIGPWAGVTSLPMCVMIHGRDPIFDDMDVSRTIGFFATGVLEVIELKDNVPPQLSPLSDPRLRYAQLLLYFSRSLEMAYETDNNEKYVSIYDKYNPQVTLNFQGRLDTLELPTQKQFLHPITIDLWKETDASVASKSLDCLVAIEQGQLRVIWRFSPRYFKYSTIDQLAQKFLQELRTFIRPE
jgi:hypothetical protein